MLVESMTEMQILDEVYIDIFEINCAVVDSGINGKIDKLRRKTKKRTSPKKRKSLHFGLELETTTQRNNHWHYQVHIFSKCEIWKGYTTIKNSKGIRTIFYELGKVFLIDSHFFSRYKERYLEFKNVNYGGSSTRYFNKENSTFSIIPVFLDELVLNDVSVLVDHGLGLGENINYQVDQTVLGEKGSKLDISYFKNYRIKTFLGFQNLRKTQLDDVIAYLTYLAEDITKQKRANLSNMHEAMLRIKIMNGNTVYNKIMPRIKEYY